MKKKIIILLLISMILTGCGNTKKLTCRYKEDTEGAEIYTYEFSKEKLKKIIVKETREAESKEQAEEDKKQAEEEMELLNQMLGTELSHKVTIKNKTVTLVIEVDVEKLPDKYKKDVETLTYDEMKKGTETLTCK